MASAVIPSRVVPQADKLEEVVRTVEAVSKGHTSFQAIAKYLSKVERQGRYYRLAAEDIGLLVNQQNQAALTQKGREFLAAPEAERRRILEEQVLANPVFRESLLHIAGGGAGGVARDNLTQYLTTRVALEEGVVRRRIATIVGWLEVLRLVQRRGSRVFIRRVPGFAAIQPSPDPTRNVFSPARKLKPYEKKLPGTTEKGADSLKAIQYTIDSALQERANAEHKKLVHLMAEKVRSAGGVPRSDNADLVTEIPPEKFVFEMKTVNPDNPDTVHDRIRYAIGQLFEYRYHYDAPGAHLVLVLSAEPSARLGWIVDFLVEVGIQVCWLDGALFRCPPACAPVIGRFTA